MSNEVEVYSIYDSSTTYVANIYADKTPNYMKSSLIVLFVFISTFTLSQNYWQKAYSSIGKCSIYFPSTYTTSPNPQTGTEVFNCLVGNSLLMFSVENGEKVRDKTNLDVYSESFKKSMYDGLLASFGGKFISDKNIYYKGKKGVEFYLSIEIPGTRIGYVKGRCVVFP